MKAFPNLDFHQLNQGMDLRDYFAAKAMQSFLKNLRTDYTEHQLVIDAYKVADAMMKARGE
jgi:hypothetical protein